MAKTAWRLRWAITIVFTALAVEVPAAATLPGGGSKRTDCFTQLAATGTPFPAGRTKPLGLTCADGDTCDNDGVRNGVCHYPVSLCINASDAPPLRCLAKDVARLQLRVRKGRGVKVSSDLGALEAAIAELGLPSTAPACTTPAPVDVALPGPDRRGEERRGVLDLRVRGRTSRGATDIDRFLLVCLPGAATPPIEPPEPPPSLPPGTPELGLRAEITAASVTSAGVVQVTFTLTDDAGVPVTPVLGSTTDPDEARVRFAIARLDVVRETQEITTEFTRYRNYVTSRQTSPVTGQVADLPTYDSGGTLALVDPSTGAWNYTFKKTLPPGFDGTLTHTIGAQVERALGGTALVANPVFDFVPAGGPVTTRREVVTTQQCNTCHNPLQAHGGGRREVRLCQLCHTDQGVDPDTGNSIDLLDMVHRIHQGRDLPSVKDGPIGGEYTIIGFQQSRHTWAEKVKACSAGAFQNIPCTIDADCGSGGTCTSSITVGVGFPRTSPFTQPAAPPFVSPEIRDCESCHAGAAQAAHYLEKPSTPACTSCHDDVNPGMTATAAGPPGTGHIAGDQPEALCRLCHTPTGEEFGDSVAGAHMIPLRSTQLQGLQAELLSASGAPSGPITVTFRLSNGAGVPLSSLTGIGRLAFAASGPTTDFGGSSTPFPRQATAFPVPSTNPGTLTGPDASNVFTYVFPDSQALPADASGTWRIGIEGRRSVPLTDPDPSDPQITVNEALQNKVLDFSVDGSPVEPRRQVVSQEKCNVCHGTFSVDFSVHGNLRNQVDYCVVCHNPRVTDFAVRNPVVAAGASPDTETVHLKVLLHKLHTGEELHDRLYIVYGNRSRPVDLGEVRFPGDRRDCQTCHLPGTNLLPLPEGLLPTRLTTIVGGVETLVEDRAPTTAACLACHDTAAALAHARINTFGTLEVCHVCHGEGRVIPVSEAHAPAP